MKEVTRIITLEITVVSKGEKVNLLKSKEQNKNDLIRFIKDRTGADDCVVTNVQDFELDFPEE